MQIKKFFITLSFLICSVTNVIAAEAPFPPQVTVNIYQNPTPLVASNKSFLVYEVYLTNYMKDPATLTSFEVWGKNKLFPSSQKDLLDSIKTINPKAQTTSLEFQPGESKIIFIWFPFENSSDIPNQISHKVALNSSFQNKHYSFTTTTDPITIEKVAPVIIKAPLHGKNWLAGNGPSNTSDHRRTGLYLHGKPFYAQRYAIDFIQLGANGKSYQGDLHKNSSYHCYNQDILAVADGKVLAVQDGIPENIPNSGKLAVEMNVKTLPGNYIILDLGNGKYADYAHLIPGSLKVKVNDYVKQGQVIAKLGNSGNSSEPHLHFQVTDKPQFLESNGIPYGFDHFKIIPSKILNNTPNDSFAIKYLDEAPKEYSNQLVLENALMDFES